MEKAQSQTQKPTDDFYGQWHDCVDGKLNPEDSKLNTNNLEYVVLFQEQLTENSRITLNKRYICTYNEYTNAWEMSVYMKKQEAYEEGKMKVIKYYPIRESNEVE